MGFRVAAAAVLVLVLKVDLQIMPVSYGIGWLSMLVYEPVSYTHLDGYKRQAPAGW